MIVIDQRHLTILAEMGGDGSRSLFRVTSPDSRLPSQLALTVPQSGDGQPALDRMQRAVSVRDMLPPQGLAELDSVTAWPLAMVARDGRNIGCLIPLVGRDYLVEARHPDGRPTLHLFDLALLGASTERLRTLGITRSDTGDPLVRLALMARLAYAVEVVHRPLRSTKLVYGDLNLRRVAVAVGPPRILLLGCEDVADVNDPSRAQLNTAFFTPPELTGRPDAGRQDQMTDVYKLGLCVIRGLSTGRGATQVMDAASPLVLPSLLDDAGIDLLNRATGVDRERRPTAEAIKDYLVGRVLQLVERRVVTPR